MDLRTFEDRLESLVLGAVDAGLGVEAIACSIREVASFYAGDVIVERYRGFVIRSNGASFYGDGADTGARPTVADARDGIDAALASGVWREAGVPADEDVAALLGNHPAP